jgi:hypothetical protein
MVLGSKKSTCFLCPINPSGCLELADIRFLFTLDSIRTHTQAFSIETAFGRYTGKIFLALMLCHKGHANVS